MKKKRVLVTGGTGYLGGRISQHLGIFGYDVVLGVRNKSCHIDDNISMYNTVEIDLEDSAKLYKACNEIDFIVHLASMNAKSCMDHPEDALLINGLGVLKLLKVARKNKISKFVYFSTAHVYGSPLSGEINEKLLPRPIHPYSITHRLAEDYILEEAYKSKLPVAILRLTNAVGSPISPRADCWMLIANDLCKQVVVNNSMVVRSNRFLQRDFVPITSVCSIVESLLASSAVNNEIFNLSSGNSLSLQSLSSLIADRSEVVLGFRPCIEFLDKTAKDNMKKLRVSNVELLNLGFKIDTNLSDEIDNLLLNCSKWFSGDL